RRLEYRGYDSAGIAIVGDQGLAMCRSVGRIDRLASCIGGEPLAGTIGLGHTRWATHGPAVEENAHPHLGGEGEVVLVHNGVIENFAALRDELTQKGYVFRSATDTEAVAHLVAEGLKRFPATEGESDHSRYVAAVRWAIGQLQGTYGLAILFPDQPD